jgi:hypothetical protein
MYPEIKNQILFLDFYNCTGSYFFKFILVLEPNREDEDDDIKVIEDK